MARIPSRLQTNTTNFANCESFKDALVMLKVLAQIHAGVDVATRHVPWLLGEALPVWRGPSTGVTVFCSWTT